MAKAPRTGSDHRRWLTAIAALATLALASLSAGPAAAADAAAPRPVSLTGVLKSYSPGTNEITVTLEGTDRTLELAAADPQARRLMGLARAGDVLTIDVDDAVEPEIANWIDAVRRPVSAYDRLLAFAAAALIVLAAASLATRFHPMRFVIGVDNRYSNSQFQLAAWFAILAVVYLAAVILRISILGPAFTGGVGITANLAALTGLSALSFGGAKVITVGKVERLARDGLPPAKTPVNRPPLLSDLFTNDRGQSDLGDFQMIAITVVAIAVFGIASFEWLRSLSLSQSVTLPDIDSSLLAGFGIGHGAYLVKKAALKAGEG